MNVFDRRAIQYKMYVVDNVLFSRCLKLELLPPTSFPESKYDTFYDNLYYDINAKVPAWGTRHKAMKYDRNEGILISQPCYVTARYVTRNIVRILTFNLFTNYVRVDISEDRFNYLVPTITPHTSGDVLSGVTISGQPFKVKGKVLTIDNGYEIDVDVVPVAVGE